jgi:hypothetical protein
MIPTRILTDPFPSAAEAPETLEQVKDNAGWYNNGLEMA